MRKDGGKSKPERRDGIVEKGISEAGDVVVCVLDPGGEENGREADGWVMSAHETTPRSVVGAQAVFLRVSVLCVNDVALAVDAVLFRSEVASPP